MNNHYKDNIIGSECVIEYLNYKGETGLRTIQVKGVYCGTTEFYPEVGLLLEAYDVEKKAMRIFSIKNIIKWFSVSDI